VTYNSDGKTASNSNVACVKLAAASFPIQPSAAGSSTALVGSDDVGEPFGI